MEKKSFLKQLLMKAVLGDINEEVENRLESEKMKWAEETAKELTKKSYSYGRIADYTSTATGKTFKASQLDPSKSWSIIYNVFSEAPGSPQCADRIRSAVTGAGYLLQPVPGKKQNPKHLEKLIEFFDAPNPEATIEDIVQNIVTNFYAFGNSYVEKAYNEGGEVAEIYTLPSEDMKILVDADKRKLGLNTPIGYEQYVPFAEGSKPEDKKIIYEMDEIMHFKRPDPRGKIYGRALFEDNQSVMQLILQALIYNIKTFENSGKPPLKIRLPEGTSSTEALEFSLFFEKNFQGMHNAGKALILYNNADAAPLGLTPEDMDYLQLLTFGLKQVAGMYGVPMIMISQPEGSNRATSNEEAKSFYQRVVKPLRNAICNKLTKSIIVDSFDIDDYYLDFKDIDLEDSSKRVDEASKSFMYGTRNFNEARKRMGEVAVDEPWANEFFVIHNGIATPLRDFSSGQAKTQSDKQKEDKDKKDKKENKEDAKKNVEKKEQTIAEAKKEAKKENEKINKGEVIDPARGDNHKAHIEEHKKVFYSTKEKYRASLRVHIYGHEDFMWEQDEEGNYDRVTSTEE
jgi:HK97 family phage portal protein